MARDPLGGYVYGIIHPKWPGYTKIGKSRHTPGRLRTYNTGDPHRAYKIAFNILTPNMHIAELQAHRLLDGYRMSGSEWFACHWRDALALLLAHYRNEETQ